MHPHRPLSPLHHGVLDASSLFLGSHATSDESTGGSNLRPLHASTHDMPHVQQHGGVQLLNVPAHSASFSRAALHQLNGRAVHPSERSPSGPLSRHPSPSPLLHRSPFHAQAPLHSFLSQQSSPHATPHGDAMPLSYSLLPMDDTPGSFSTQGMSLLFSDEQGDLAHMFTAHHESHHTQQGVSPMAAEEEHTQPALASQPIEQRGLMRRTTSTVESDQADQSEHLPSRVQSTVPDGATVPASASASMSMPKTKTKKAVRGRAAGANTAAASLARIQIHNSTDGASLTPLAGGLTTSPQMHLDAAPAAGWIGTDKPVATPEAADEGHTQSATGSSTTAAASSSTSEQAAATATVDAAAAATAARMSVAWSTLSRWPELDSLARQHIQQLDRAMEAVCTEMLKRTAHGESGGQTATGQNVDTSAFSQLMERVGTAFCSAGEQVVEHFRALAQRAEEGLEASQSQPNPASSFIHGAGSASAAGSEVPYAGSVSSRSSTSASVSSSPRVTGRKQPRPPPSAADSPTSVAMLDESGNPKRRKANTQKKAVASAKPKRGEADVFSPHAVSILRRWLQAHLDDPYPDAIVKTSLAEATQLSYEQVQHWFINARMRFWRPMLRARAEALAQQGQAEPADASATADADADVSMGAGLADLSSVAAQADAVAVAAAVASSAGTAEQGSAASSTGTTTKPARLTSYAAFVPRSGRSYMIAEVVRGESPTSTSTPAATSPSCETGVTAEFLAASALALSIATSYQTPHTYASSHPLHHSGKKYKSGGSHKKAAHNKGKGKTGQVA